MLALSKELATCFPGSSVVKNPSAMHETQVRSLGQEYPLEKGMVTHSSVLAWRIPWTEGPVGLQSMGLQRIGHDLATTSPPPPPQCYPDSFQYFPLQINWRRARIAKILTTLTWQGDAGMKLQIPESRPRASQWDPGTCILKKLTRFQCLSEQFSGLSRLQKAAWS